MYDDKAGRSHCIFGWTSANMTHVLKKYAEERRPVDVAVQSTVRSVDARSGDSSGFVLMDVELDIWRNSRSKRKVLQEAIRSRRSYGRGTKET